MRALVVLGVVVTVIVVPIFAVRCSREQKEADFNARRDANIRRRAIEAATPGTEAYAQVQAEQQRLEQAKVDAARPRMKLPDLRPLDLIYEPTANVQSKLGATVQSAGETDTAGAITVEYRKGRASKVIVRPENYFRDRDENALREWAAFPRDEDIIERFKRVVQFVPDDLGAAFVDITETHRTEQTAMDAARRQSFAESLEQDFRLKGQNATVRVRGKGNTILRIQWTGCSTSHVTAYVASASFERNAYAFRRVECDDGHVTHSVDWE